MIKSICNYTSFPWVFFSKNHGHVHRHWGNINLRYEIYELSFFCFIIGGSVKIVGFFPVFSESQNGYVLNAT